MTKELNISLTEFDNLEFFEILFILDEYKNWIDEQNKSRTEQEEQYTAEVERVRSNVPDYNSMSNNIGKNMPQMQMPNISVPKFSMPSFPVG